MSPFDNAESLSTGYVARPEPSAQAKAGYWKAAFGLQAVDGLAPSECAHELAEANTRGELPIAEVMRELSRH